jgi:transposase
MQAKVAVKRKRRRHSEEFRARVVAACRQPGVSVAAVALAHGLNANLVRRWIKENTQSLPVPRQPMTTPVAEPLMVVPVSIDSAEGRSDDAIRIDIRRSGLAVQLAWPATRAVELSGLLKDLLT